jgi:hypothetical protein
LRRASLDASKQGRRTGRKKRANSRGVPPPEQTRRQEGIPPTTPRWGAGVSSVELKMREARKRCRHRIGRVPAGKAVTGVLPAGRKHNEVLARPHWWVGMSLSDAGFFLMTMCRASSPVR